ncbi:MAG: PhoX family protein [Wenzhouxiangella sp.]
MPSKPQDLSQFDFAHEIDSDDPICNPLHGKPFHELLEEAGLARRRLLQGSLAGAVALMISPGVSALAGSAASSRPASPLLGFKAIATSAADTVVVPEGYRVQVILPWGEPITGRYPSFDPLGASNTAEDQEQQIGMNHDGMHFFPALDEDGQPRSDEGILVMNHEYVDWLFLHPQGPTLTAPRPTAEVRKEMAAHGVSVVEIRRDSLGQWSALRSPRNRRITAMTPMQIAGPAAGHELLRTRYSPDGRRTRGTMNNCAHGVTPWGTYLTCEENWANYFCNREQRPPREHSRYGVRSAPGQLGWYSVVGWHTVNPEDDVDQMFSRFDATPIGETTQDDYRNEPNTFGWIVEIDPRDPDSVPIKRTALGRFAHEGMIFQPAEPGKRLVGYSGDDARFEYIYKYVSKDVYDPETAGGHLLNEGTLYAARFDAGGRGRWMALEHGRNGLNAAAGFRDQAEILINARAAADRVGATPMDRPEWGAVHPQTREVYFTLTNNTQRDSGNVNAANPRGPNRFGHIIRWREDNPVPGPGEDPGGFSWDVFVFAGDHDHGSVGGRPLNDSNVFAAPDGLWIDADGRLWIQTDISRGNQNTGDHEVFGNNQMLCADPATGEIQRFLTGPVGQEITGVITTPDQTTLFVNVQHPGETTSAEQFANGEWTSHWPGGAPNRPRSATLAISRIDGGKVGT